MLRLTTATPVDADTGRGDHRSQRVLAASTVAALAATVLGTMTLGTAPRDDAGEAVGTTTGPSLTVSFLPASDPASCTVVGSFAGFVPGEVAVRYTALAAGVLFEHPEVGETVTIGADGTAVATFAPYLRSDWADASGDAFVQLAAGGVESDLAEVEC